VTGPWFADERLAALARDRPEAPAVVERGAVALTWAALDARAGSVADAVRADGVRPRDRVALLADAPAAMLAAIVGVLRVGAVAAPIPAGLTLREQGAALRSVQPALVVRVASLEGRPAPGDLTGGPPAARDPEGPAVVVLTSGTTGAPEAVVLSHRAMAASAASWLAALPPVTGWVLALGLGHVAGLGIAWRALCDGVPVHVVPRDDPAALLAAARADPAPSHVSLVPTQLARLLEAAASRSSVAAPPATLRAVLVGGGPIPAVLVSRAIDAGWPVVPTYGLTQTASGATALATTEARRHPGSAGRALPGTRVEIAEPGPDGVGEILVTSPARASGTVGGDPATPDEPVRTGDLGRLDADGRLWVVDRRLDRIVRGGENVAPAEVEAVLQEHPAVAEAAVVGRPDRDLGGVPVAAVVLRADLPPPSDDELAAHARASLAGFKVPAGFLRLDALPRTPGGKLRRAGLRALIAGEPAGELARPGGDAIGWRVTGSGPGHLLLLHGTLSTAEQLDRLADALAAAGDRTVHAIDRRGSGTGRMREPGPLDVATHVDDLRAYLDARGIARAEVAGVSFGGVLALELAARLPDRVAAVVAYEPPYGAVAGPERRAWFERVAEATRRAHAERGPAAAAETFLRAVAGDTAWERLPDRGRAFLAGEGDGALADSAMRGLDPGGLARVACPVAILTGTASEPFYAPISDALAARIPGARRQSLEGMDHPAPITRPAPVAAAFLACLEAPA
jgi:O-succinylbenzoic acid--CoA ligase